MECVGTLTVSKVEVGASYLGSHTRRPQLSNLVIPFDLQSPLNSIFQGVHNVEMGGSITQKQKNSPYNLTYKRFSDVNLKIGLVLKVSAMSAHDVMVVLPHHSSAHLFTIKAMTNPLHHAMCIP